MSERKEKWTGGEWKHDKNFPTSVWADHVWIGSSNVEFVKTMDEKQANAQLFASAPELYAALTELVESLWQDFNTDDASESPQITKARAALASARGENQ